MDDAEFDRAMVDAAFAAIGVHGWRSFRVAAAARDAGLPLDRARLRFPCRTAVLACFGRLADAAALEGVSADGPVRDTLFDMLMRRIDVLQSHRAGASALLRALPMDPLLAAFLAAASLRSMGWLLEAAGIPASGPLGLLRQKGLLAVWLWTVRAWLNDETDDLSATMAALDQALARAEQVEGWLSQSRGSVTTQAASAGEEGAETADASAARLSPSAE